MVTCLHAAARPRRAARAVQGEVLSVGQVLHGTLSAPRISAQRSVLFGDHFTRNLHVPADLVVDRWPSDGERGLHRHFLFRHDVWTMFRG